MKKRLYRSQKEKMVAGIAGGLAHYYDMDPSIMRIIFLLAIALTHGLGILVYILLIYIIPKNLSE